MSALDVHGVLGFLVGGNFEVPAEHRDLPFVAGQDHAFFVVELSRP